MGKRGMNRKGQVTIFIIVAVVLVAAVLLYFVVKGKNPLDLITPTMPNPSDYIDQCIQGSVLDATNIMLPQGGLINPTNYILYRSNKVEYLCYNQNFYSTCINQEPMYVEHLQQEIKTYIEPKIKDCFFSLEQEYKNKGYSVNSGEISNLKVSLMPKKIQVDFSKKLSITKSEETMNFEKFSERTSSSLYELAVVAQEITSQEARFCNFDYVGYSILYPAFSIQKDQIGSGVTASKIYIINDKASGKSLFIAVRSCAMPGGL
jgi:hypothetical protein